MYRVLTVAREFGSGGGCIARLIAEKLGWSLLDNALIQAIAQTAQVDPETARRYDESVDSWWHRINRGGLWSTAMASGADPGVAGFFDAETMAAFAKVVIKDAATKGNCVIVGRGAQCVLHDMASAFHVYVYAPWSQRVARIHERQENCKNVPDIVRGTDHIRAAYIKRYFGSDWKDPHLYHMMVSSSLGDENVARLILAAIQPNG